MFVDTHCHLNIMVKKEFDRPLTEQEIVDAQSIITEAANNHVTTIINVGTSLTESINSIVLAQKYTPVYASIGLHPNDCTAAWREDIKELAVYLQNKERHKIIAIGECGFDKHYPNFNLIRQKEAFKAQVELALEYELPLLIHSRNAVDETLYALDEFKNDPIRGIIHCFSEDLSIAQEYIKRRLLIGIGGTVTYPANEKLRTVVKNIDLKDMVLETDAPFLPPQEMRGQQNSPKNIAIIAAFLAQLRTQAVEEIAKQTTTNVKLLCNIDI